jgi:hypothetical protein
MPKAGLPDQAVYLDSPVLSAVRQIQPFFTSGAFGISDTPLILRHKPLVRLQRMLTPLPKELDVRWIRGRATQLPVASGGVVFYPFNARSNLQTVTRRDLHHVLTLHGESNKAASMRPAARLYDYVCIAGPLARDRYLQAGIFTPDDVDRGRLVMMGDTFVQPMPEIRPARAQDADPALFYAPTWEGFGGAQDNHSSICGLRGFEAAVQGAKYSGIGRVVIRPHPYLGLLRPQILRQFLAGLRLLRRAGLRVAVWLQEASLPLRLACLSALGSGVEFVQEPRGIEAEPVALGLCDVSGMEAIFLKQRIAHMVLTRAAAVPSSLAGLYQHKALLPDSDVAPMMARYLDAADEVDAAHRAQVFGWAEPSLAGGSAAGARGWLINYVRQDPFWQRGAADGRSLG